MDTTKKDAAVPTINRRHLLGGAAAAALIAIGGAGYY